MQAILNKLQKQTLEFFAKWPLAKDFYWAGGTLLSAVYLQHRLSEDLDIFSDKPFNPQDTDNFIQDLKKHLQLKEITRRKVADRFEYLISNGEKLRIEFVFYDFPKLRNRKLWNKIKIDSLFDIAANKTMAMFDRNEAKDIFDLYFLITKKHIQVKDMLLGCKKKFGFKVPEDGFWSESMKSVRKLEVIKPFLINKTEKEKTELLEEIKDFFTRHSNYFLRQFLK